MILDSYALEAFFAVSQMGSFTKAAQRLHITQSALSQRVAGLEASLGLTLFLRSKQGVRLTPAGKRLLQYSHAKMKLEEELLGDLQSQGESLRGQVRVTGFSSVVRSVLLPGLAPLLRENPGLGLELQSREISEIPAALLQGETDFALLFEPVAREGVRADLVGKEEYVLTEARNGPVCDAFLDHHEDDEITLKYLRRHDQSRTKLKRRYLDEVYALADGVAQGLGRAVLPRHLIKSDKRIRVVQPGKVLSMPVYLNYFEQPYYTRLQEEALRSLKKSFADWM